MYVMRPEKKRFLNCVALTSGLASDISSAIKPKNLSDLNSALQKIMSGSVWYYIYDHTEPSMGAQCQCVIDGMAIFFNENPPGTLELVDVQRQP